MGNPCSTSSGVGEFRRYGVQSVDSCSTSGGIGEFRCYGVQSVQTQTEQGVQSVQTQTEQEQPRVDPPVELQEPAVPPDEDEVPYPGALLACSVLRRAGHSLRTVIDDDIAYHLELVIQLALLAEVWSQRHGFINDKNERDILLAQCALVLGVVSGEQVVQEQTKRLQHELRDAIVLLCSGGIPVNELCGRDIPPDMRERFALLFPGVDEQSRKCLAELGAARHRVFADGKKWSRRPRRVKDRQLQ